MCRATTHALIGGLGSDASRRSPIETRDEPADIIGRVIISALLDKEVREMMKEKREVRKRTKEAGEPEEKRRLEKKNVEVKMEDH